MQTKMEIKKNYHMFSNQKVINKAKFQKNQININLKMIPT